MDVTPQGEGKVRIRKLIWFNLAGIHWWTGDQVKACWLIVMWLTENHPTHCSFAMKLSWRGLERYPKPAFFSPQCYLMTGGLIFPLGYGSDATHLTVWNHSLAALGSKQWAGRKKQRESEWAREQIAHVLWVIGKMLFCWANEWTS